MAAKPPDAFLSYTRFDDQHDGGAIGTFCQRLGSAVQAVTGAPFGIFRDVEGIGIGEHWPNKLDQMLEQARFFIPIVTPSYFTSRPCREELEKFLRAEAERRRKDLVLPIYYIECDVLEDDDLRAADALARRIHERQRQDWRDLRFEAPGAAEVRRALERLARDIVKARKRAMPGLAYPAAMDIPHPHDQRVHPTPAVATSAQRAKSEQGRPLWPLLQELQALAKAHRDDAVMCEELARGLVKTLNHAEDERDLVPRDGLLDDLQALAQAHPEDAALREGLAWGLFSTLYHAKDEQDLARRNDLLDELRALAKKHPAAAREWLAKGLFKTLVDAKAEQDLFRQDELLDELRALAKAHPEDAAVREPLAAGLAKTMFDAADEGKPQIEAALRAEFLRLADAHPADGWVKQFGWADYYNFRELDQPLPDVTSSAPPPIRTSTNR